MNKINTSATPLGVSEQLAMSHQNDLSIELLVEQQDSLSVAENSTSTSVGSERVDFKHYQGLTVEINGNSFPLTSALEVLLFVSDGSVEVSSLTKTLELNSEVVYGALRALDDQYCKQNSGLRIQEHNGRFQLVTHPHLAALIETYLSLDLTTKLSAPALETLAIIAYRQPVTRAQIESVRGVDSSGILRSLLQRGLVEEAGRLDGVGRPILYNVTEEFMHHFGLTGLDELPQLETTDADTLWAATKLSELEGAGVEEQGAE